jgi:gluconokinase
MSIVLAVDIGTGSAKALAVDQAGQEVYSSRAGYATFHPQHDYSEQNPDEIFRAVKKIIRDCPASVKKEVAAISFSSAMHSLMAVEETGTPLSPLIIWSDLRSREESIELRGDKQNLERLSKTGTPVHPMSPLCKLMWLRKNQPDLYDKAHKFIGIKEYVWFSFFQEFEVDQGIASATGLLETGGLNWFSPAVALAGLEAVRLSTPVSVYHHRWLSDPALLEELGFSNPVKCVIGSSDGCLANLGSNAMDSETLSLTIGTSGAVRRAVKRYQQDPQGRVFHYHLDEETIIEGGASNNGAALLDWFSRNFLKEELSMNAFVERALQVPGGAEGLIFLPYVFGERAPHYDPDAAGVFFGVRHHHTLAHFMRAVLEGVGFAMYSIAALLEASSGPYSRVVASGGFTNSPEWVQLIADIFGKPVHLNHHEDASALGAAILGFRAIGENCSVSMPSSIVFHPDETRHKKYIAGYSIFSRLSEKFSEEFHLLSGIH